MSEITGIEKLPANAHSKIGRVLSIASGKGGVGKSSVSALMAVEAQRMGYSVGLLDADITGPSIPKMFGVRERAQAGEEGLNASETQSGIKLMSINLLLEHEEDPVVWRGPLIGSAVQQFWTDVIWGELDYLIVDLPPGTGDSPLTVMQFLPLDGSIIVTSPQSLAHMVVRKAIKMNEIMDIKVLGLVENMAYIDCTACSERLYPFGRPSGESFAAELGLEFLGSLAIDPKFTEACDAGKVEEYHGPVHPDFSKIAAQLPLPLKLVKSPQKR